MLTHKRFLPAPLASDVDFDVIVVGAGIAGSVTAYQLATAGHSVALIERGVTPGSKNMSGGLLYSDVFRHIYGEHWDNAPTERTVNHHRLVALTEDASVSLDYRDDRLSSTSAAVSVLRGPFDAWLAEQAEIAGATMLTGIHVDEVLTAGQGAARRVIGVRADQDEVRCHVVVAADGVHSFLAQNVGLHSAPQPRHLGLGLKTVIGLPSATINERFGLTDTTGAAWSLIGDATQGLPGGGFLYTNQDSVSVGLVLHLDALAESAHTPTDLLDRLLHHAVLAPYVRGGTVLEYGSHLVSEDASARINHLVMPGFLVVGEAAGLVLNTGFTIRGMDVAAESALLAAQTITAALASHDVSFAALNRYRDALLANSLGRDLRTYARTPAFLKRRRLYDQYGRFVASVLGQIHLHDRTPRPTLAQIVRAQLPRAGLTWRTLLDDLIAGGRSL